MRPPELSELQSYGIETNIRQEQLGELTCLQREDLHLLPERPARSHKGSFGCLLLIAGSCNMAGAAAFAAKAAYRCGVGLVKILSPEENRQILQTLIPEAVLVTYREEDSAEELEVLLQGALERCTAAVLGPGLGTGKAAKQLLRLYRRNGLLPCVLDADALNLTAGRLWELKEYRSPVILTPHPGEMSRLYGQSTGAFAEKLLSTAQSFAREHGCITLLKDAHTVTAMPDGRAFINTSGNCGMATGGSGDVLAGIIGALLAQRLEPELAAPLGAYVHGLAGDAAARKLGTASVMASDIIEGLPEVLRQRYPLEEKEWN